MLPENSWEKTQALYIFPDVTNLLMIGMFHENFGHFMVKLLCWRCRSGGEPLLGSWLKLLNWTGLGMSAEVSCYKDAFQHQGLANWLGMTGKVNTTRYREIQKKNKKTESFCQKARTGKEVCLSTEQLSWEHGESSTAGRRKMNVLDWTRQSPDLMKLWQLFRFPPPLIHIYLDAAWGISLVKNICIVACKVI